MLVLPVYFNGYLYLRKELTFKTALPEQENIKNLSCLYTVSVYIVVHYCICSALVMVFGSDPNKQLNHRIIE